MSKQIHVLDTTLRDGSYAVKKPITPSDTAAVCEALDKAGVEFIEIGDGAGLNAKKLGWSKLVGTDEDHMRAAREVIKRAKYGFFCIPGIARLEDIDLAHQYGVGFLRMGTYPKNAAQTKNFIERAKGYGMLVSVNLMKSYTLPPDQFAFYAKLVEGFGADVIYIVDSAGGMFPEDVLGYYRAIRNVSKIEVGFHGHDNLGLAVANSLTLADAGVSFIDVSLQGLGRSAGNTVAEIMLPAFKKRGYETGIDILKVMDAGESLIRPFIETKGKNPLDAIAGFADFAFFESSYLPQIINVAKKYGIHPAILIIEICKIDKLNPLSTQQIEKLAQEIREGRSGDLGPDLQRR